MASQLGPLEVECDAPSYAVVRACRSIGVHSPEDVRWCRLSHYLSQGGWKGLFQALTWNNLLGRGETDEKCCSCGVGLPLLEKVTFTFTSGRQESYLMAQCQRCGTVFWEEA